MIAGLPREAVMAPWCFIDLMQQWAFFLLKKFNMPVSVKQPAP
jgi:hypothetical protein